MLPLPLLPFSKEILTLESSLLAALSVQSMTEEGKKEILIFTVENYDLHK